MNHARRHLLKLALGGASLPVLSKLGRAQDYPSRPIKWMLGYTPGGTTDIISRIVTQPLSEKLGQPIIIETKPGAGTNIATETVIRAEPDGYTLLFAGAPNAINAALYAKLNFDFIRDIAPIVGLARVPAVLVVHPSVPAKSVPELIAYAKANPAKINMASSGVGSTPHLAGELFKMMAGVDIQHIPYRGAAPAITDVMAGQVQLYFTTTPVSMEYIRSGRLRPLGVTTSERLAEALPDVPAIAEFVPGFEASAWYGIAAPKGTPAAAIERLNRETNAVLADAKIKARFDELGCVIIGGSAADFGKLIADETEKWAKVIKFAGLKAE